MTNIVALKNPVNGDLVEMLDELLASARSGKLVSGHFCGTLAGGSVWTISAETSNLLLEMAAVLRLQHRLNKMADDEIE